MAQGQVNINPNEVEQFVKEILNFLETQQQATNRLNHAFDTLSSTWQDEKRVQFEETYRELLQILSKFQNISNDQVGYLKSLISIQREYQSR